MKYYIHKNLFDQNFMTFIENILYKIIEEDKILSKNYQELIKICFLYFFTILARAKDKENLPKFLKSLKNILTNNIEISNWLLSSLSNENILKETLIDCPWREMKTIFLEIYKSASKAVDNYEKNLDFSQFKTGNLAKFISASIYVLYECRAKKKLMEYFFKLFNYFSNYSKNCKQLLINAKFIGRLWYYLNDTLPPTNSYIDFKEFHISDAIKDLGLPNIENNDNLIKSFEEIAEKKKEKSYLDTISANYSNLIVCLCNLAVSSRLTINNKENNKMNIKFKIENEEINYIKSAALWKKIMSEAQNNFCNKYVCDFFSYICLRNDNISCDLMNMLFEEMNESDDNEIKIYFKVAESILSINDEMQPKRVINSFYYEFIIIFV